MSAFAPEAGGPVGPLAGRWEITAARFAAFSAFFWAFSAAPVSGAAASVVGAGAASLATPLAFLFSLPAFGASSDTGGVRGAACLGTSEEGISRFSRCPRT